MDNLLLETPIGTVQVGMDAGVVQTIDLQWQTTVSEVEPEVGYGTESNPQLESVRDALMSYFTMAVPLHKIPHQPRGTPFQLRVWQTLCEIPLGRVMTYGALATVLGSSPRAVGGACRNNPIPLIIPCHRVVSKGGVGGFSGQWGEGERVSAKQWLLQHEGAIQ